MKIFSYHKSLFNKLPSPQKVVLWICIVAIAFINSRSLFKNNDNHYISFYFWIINFILFYFALGGLHFKCVNILDGFNKYIKENKRVILLISFIFFAGFILRVSYLESVPANVGGDEMSQALESWKFAQGVRSDIFSPNEWYSSPNFYFYVTSFLFRILGKSVWVWRFGSVLFGSITVLLSYILFSELFSKRIALFASILLVFYHVHIHFSRLGAHQITDAFWIILRRF